MKLARIVCAALALSLIAGWATSSSACDNHKGTKASAAAAASKGAACSAAMAANCTPEMMAACKASMAAGGPDLCVGMKASTVAASAGDHCGMAKASAVSAAAHGTCGAKSASATAVNAVNSPSATKMIHLAGSNGSCGTKGAKATTAAAGQCSGHGMASMAAMSGHADCEACVDMADCSGALDAAGAHRQTVRLKNGIMYVYTADSPRTVGAVQAAVARRAERMTRFASAGEKTRLCGECKVMRGAMASGKLNREVVNIEGGSLTLVTSTDATVVAKIHAMADDKVAVRVKS